ncbi:hypothetical protein ACWGPQ_02705 [Saccharomonospora azurea]
MAQFVDVRDLVALAVVLPHRARSVRADPRRARPVDRPAEQDASTSGARDRARPAELVAVLLATRERSGRGDGRDVERGGDADRLTHRVGGGVGVVPRPGPPVLDDGERRQRVVGVVERHDAAVRAGDRHRKAVGVVVVPGHAAERIGAGEQLVVAVPLEGGHVAQRVRLAHGLVCLVELVHRGAAEGVGVRGDATLGVVDEDAVEESVGTHGAHAPSRRVVHVAVPDAVAVLPARDPTVGVVVEALWAVRGVHDIGQPAVAVVTVSHHEDVGKAAGAQDGQLGHPGSLHPEAHPNPAGVGQYRGRSRLVVGELAALAVGALHGPQRQDRP